MYPFLSLITSKNPRQRYINFYSALQAKNTASLNVSTTRLSNYSLQVTKHNVPLPYFLASSNTCINVPLPQFLTSSNACTQDTRFKELLFPNYLSLCTPFVFVLRKSNCVEISWLCTERVICCIRYDIGATTSEMLYH